MKCLLLFPLLLIIRLTDGRSGNGTVTNPEFIDPTGTYILTGTVRNNQVTSHSGELRVRLLNRHSAAVCFYINKGYPGYESGSFVDTLSYEDNRLVWTPVTDTTCSVLFDFLPAAVEIMRVVSDLTCGCGFGPDVFTPATFYRSSRDIPIIQDLSGHGSRPSHPD
jgi:hypothetical protein